MRAIHALRRWPLDATRRRPLVVAGVLLLASGLAILAQMLLDGRNVPFLALALYLVAIALVAAVFFRQRDEVTGDRIPIRVELVLLLLIFGLAVALRSFRLEQMPPGLHTDETIYGLEGADIAETGSRPLWSDILVGGRATGHAYATAAFFKVLGIEPFSLRLVSVVAGSLTVLALYGFAREAFGVRTALFSAFLLAVSRWHINYSRIGWEIILAPMAGIAALYFLFRGLRTGNPWWYAASGAALAAGMYTYVSFRVVPFAFAALLLVILLNDRQAFLRQHWRGLAAFAIVALIVFAPMGKWALENQDRFNSRFNDVSVFSVDEPWESLGENLGRQLSMVNYRGPPFPHQNLPGSTMLITPFAIVFALGLGVVAARIWRPQNAAIVLIIAAGTATAVLAVPHETPHAHRAIMAVPMVALVAGLFLSEATVALQRLVPGPAKFAVIGLAFAIVAWIAASESNVYFNKLPQLAPYWNDFKGDATLAARYVDDEGDDADIFVSSFFYHFPRQSRLEFIAYHETYEQLNPALHVPASTNRDVIYLLQPAELALVPFLDRVYPSGVVETHRNPFDGISFVTYRVSQGQVDAIEGLDATYYATPDWSGPPTVERREPTVGGAAPPSLEPPYSIEWRGSLFVPASASYRLFVEGDGEGSVVIDGRTHEGFEFLLAGLHQLDVRFQQDGAQPPVFMQDVAGVQSPVPADSLFALDAGLNGLSATYWTNFDFQGPPSFAQIDRAYYANDLVIGPYGVEWRGWIRIDQPGPYTFELFADDGATLTIDGEPVVSVDYADPERADRQIVTIVLEEGFHPFEMRYWQVSGGTLLDMRWAPPGQETTEPLPMDVLYYTPPANEPAPTGR